MNMMKTGAFGSDPNKAIHLIRNPGTAERARAIGDDWFCKASISSNFLLKHLEQV